jgi:predicted ATPase
MIIRLKIKGFKNLKEAELYFGPFTCIAGQNGVGKSNLFDALQFLSSIADNNLIEAATSIRVEKEKKRSGSDIQNLFYHDGNGYAKEMEFDMDMIIPQKGVDHLGQEAKATTTILNYRLKIGFREKDIENLGQPKSILEILFEELRPLKKAEIKPILKKIGAKNEWIDSVIQGTRQNSTSFIETDPLNAEVIIRQDQNQGNKKKMRIDFLPRTVLSTANAIENPTMLLVKKEMESWRILQFEPSSLRSTDDIELVENPQVDVNGGHLPSTLYRLTNDKSNSQDVKSQIANRLTELIEDVFEIDIDKDDKRGTLTLIAKSQNGPFLPARSLSDGTLRFLALSIMQADPQMQGIICLEEPENGIHPRRISPMIKLLQDIACDITLPIDNDNPLRQVIINTHSPLVVGEVMESSLLFAQSEKSNDSKYVIYKGLKGTWRESLMKNHLNKADLVNYLNPLEFESEIEKSSKARKTEVKVRERTELVGQIPMDFSNK